MANLLPAHMPLDLERRLEREVPCPTCAAPVIGFSVTGSILTAADTDRDTVDGQVAVKLTVEGGRVAMVPCGCRFELDGKAVPHEVPC